MKDFPFGAAFFMPSDGLEQDFRNMKASNMNVARLEWIKNGVWEAVEQSPGVYSFDVMDEAMDAAAKAGIKVMLQIGIHPPRWVRDRYGGEGVINEQGVMPYPKEKFSICNDNPKIIELAEKYIRAMVRRYREHPALYGWVSWNEPHLSYSEITCYCSHTVKKFQGWLKQKYTDLDTLNQAWIEGYPSYTSWDEVEPPRQMPRGRGIYQAWQDFRAFMDQNFADLLRWVDRVIKEEDDKHPTKMNFLIPVGNSTVRGADVWEMADTADEIGVSLFVEINEGDFPQLISQSADLIRSALAYHDRPFWLDEIQGGPTFVSHSRPLMPPDNLIELYPWQSIAHGAKGFTYWMWRPLAVGLEAGEFGLVARDGSLRPRAASAAKAGAVLRENAELLLKANPENDVCMMHSQAIFHLAFGEGMDIQAGLGNMEKPAEKARYSKAIMGAYSLLWEEKFGTDFINPKHMAAGGLDKYKALVLPFPYLLEHDAGAAVKKFVESGGLVITEFPNVMKNEGGRMHEVSPGAGLRDLFGFEEIDMAHMEEDSIVLDDGSEIPAGPMRQIVALDRDTSVLARFSDGNPAIVFKRHGQGGVLSFCAEVFHPVLWREHDGLARLIRQYLQAFGINRAGEVRSIEPRLARRVQIAELNAPQGRVIIVANHNNEPISGELFLNNPGQLIDLQTGEEVAVQGGSVSLNLENHGVLALHSIDS